MIRLYRSHVVNTKYFQILMRLCTYYKYEVMKFQFLQRQR